MLNICILGSSSIYNDSENGIPGKSPFLGEINELMNTMEVNDMQTNIYIIDPEYHFSLLADDPNEFPKNVNEDYKTIHEYADDYIYPMSFSEFKKINLNVFAKKNSIIYISYLKNISNSYDLFHYLEEYNFKNRYCCISDVKISLIDVIKEYIKMINNEITNSKILSAPVDIYSCQRLDDLLENSSLKPNKSDIQEIKYIINMSKELIIQLLKAECHLKKTTIPVIEMNDWVYSMELPIYKAIIFKYIEFPQDITDISPRLEFRKSADFRRKMTLKMIHIVASLLGFEINSDLKTVEFWENH